MDWAPTPPRSIGGSYLVQFGAARRHTAAGLSHDQAMTSGNRQNETYRGRLLCRTLGREAS